MRFDCLHLILVRHPSWRNIGSGSSILVDRPLCHKEGGKNRLVFSIANFSFQLQKVPFWHYENEEIKVWIHSFCTPKPRLERLQNLNGKCYRVENKALCWSDDGLLNLFRILGGMWLAAVVQGGALVAAPRWPHAMPSDFLVDISHHIFLMAACIHTIITPWFDI